MLRKKFKWIIIILMLIFIAIIIFIFAKVRETINKCETLIYPGISINEIDVSFLTEEQALKKVKTYIDQVNEERIIKIQVDEKSYETSFQDLGVEINIDEIVKIALNYGKKDKFLDKYKYITKGMNRNFKTLITINDESYNSLVKLMKKEQNKVPVNATIDHEWNGFFITPHELGRSIDVEGLKKDIKEAIEEAQNEESILVTANFVTEYPKILEEDLKVIDSLISTYTTSFSTSTFGRSRNIEVAAAYLDNTVVMPGEEFSFNKKVGAATSEKGFQYAKGIRDGVFVDEIGGGVCQVSTTLYNAILKTRLKIVERRNHSKVISYVPRGRDAMIAYGVSDLKFMNDLGYPILIESIVENKQITFNIYSYKEEKKKNYTIETKIVKEIKPKREIVYDYDLAQGSEIIKQQGKIGYVINTYRVLYNNGEVVEKELVGESYYEGKNTIVRVGKR